MMVMMVTVKEGDYLKVREQKVVLTSNSSGSCHPHCSMHERQRGRFTKHLSPMVTQQSQNNSVLAWDPNLQREMIQECSGITPLSDQGHGAMRELPWPHESARVLTWSCARSVFHNQVLCHFTSESLLRNKTHPIHFYVMIITGKVFRNRVTDSLPMEC